MPRSKPYRSHLKTSNDLVTSYEAVRTGFVSLAMEKNRRATPYVEEARALKASASKARTPNALLNIKEIQPALLTAAGLSDKALTHLQNDDKIGAVRELIRNFLEPAGTNFIEELVFRFLLIRGDALGGSMRNIGGFLAQRKLTRAIISALRIAGKAYYWLNSSTNSWVESSDDDADIELFLRGLSWQWKKAKPRTIVYNLTIPFLKNNVDFCLLGCSYKELELKHFANTLISLPASYLAIGELKGGIDPAGADEHWKTAGTALNRIQSAFSDKGAKPYTFYIGAAIEKKMAGEIWEMLEQGLLDNAANLTSDIQVASLSRWLCQI